MKKRKIIFQYNAPATLTFALLALIVLIASYFLGSSFTQKFFCVYRSSLLDPLTYLRFFTHVVGHADLSHYTGNIVLMLTLGPTLEERYGSRTIFATIAITALVSGLIQWIFFPQVALMGASGIVFMMIIMASLGGMQGGGIPLTLVFVFVFYVGNEIYDGFVLSDNVSQLTHVVGGICGAVLGIFHRNSGRR